MDQIRKMESTEARIGDFGLSEFIVEASHPVFDMHNLIKNQIGHSLNLILSS